MPTTDVMVKAIEANDIKNTVGAVYDGTVTQTVNWGAVNKFVSAENMETRLTNRFDDYDYYGN